MIERGASRQGKVAIYTYNHPAYMEGVYAAMKAALVPVNVNYRYREEELRYLLDNADAEIVVVHEEFVPVLRGGRRPAAAAARACWSSPTAPAPSLDGLANAALYETVAEHGSAGAGGAALRPTIISSSTPAAPPACRRA